MSCLCIPRPTSSRTTLLPLYPFLLSAFREHLVSICCAPEIALLLSKDRDCRNRLSALCSVPLVKSDRQETCDDTKGCVGYDVGTKTLWALIRGQVPTQSQAREDFLSSNETKGGIWYPIKKWMCPMVNGGNHECYSLLFPPKRIQLHPLELSLV